MFAPKYSCLAAGDLSAHLTTGVRREVGKKWIEDGIPGRIINVASLASFQGGVRMAGYAASKGGIAMLTKALSNEWAKHGIRVNAIAPG